MNRSLALKVLSKTARVSKIAHFQADQGLGASRGGCRDFRLQTHKGSVFQLKEHFAFYIDGIDQCGHFLLEDRARRCRAQLGFP